MSPPVQQRLNEAAGAVYRKTLLTPADPEYGFVARYFESSAPPNQEPDPSEILGAAGSGAATSASRAGGSPSDGVWKGDVG